MEKKLRQVREGDEGSPEGGGVPECLQCAACCFGPGDRYVPVTGDDYERLGPDAPRWTRFLGNRCYMRMDPEGHCVAMAPEDGRGRRSCRVYELRPEVCRALERGGSACELAIERHFGNRSS